MRIVTAVTASVLIVATGCTQGHHRVPAAVPTSRNSAASAAQPMFTTGRCAGLTLSAQIGASTVPLTTQGAKVTVGVKVPVTVVMRAEDHCADAVSLAIAPGDAGVSVPRKISKAGTYTLLATAGMCQMFYSDPGCAGGLELLGMVIVQATN